MKPIALKMFWLLAVSLGTASCTTIAPPVHLADIRIADMNSIEGTAAASVLIENPGSKALQIDSAEYQIYLEGTYIGRAETDVPVEVPPGDQAAQTLTLQIQDNGALPVLKRLMEGEQLAYQLEGMLHREDGRKMLVQEQGKFE